MKFKLTIIFILVFLSFTGCSKSNQWGFNKNDIESILAYDIENPSNNVSLELSDTQSNEIINKLLDLKLLNYSDFDPPTSTFRIEIKLKNNTEKHNIYLCKGEDYFIYADNNDKQYLLKSSSFIDYITNIADE